MECPICHRHRGLPRDVANHIRMAWDANHTAWLERQGFKPLELISTGNWFPVIQYLEKMATNKE
jgi:hypothetical protein